MNTILRNFWAYGAVGHTNSEGTDVGQEFLQSTFSGLPSTNFMDCAIYSHFEQETLFSRVVEQINYMSNRSSQSELSRRTRLHGHYKKEHKLDKSVFNIWYTSENVRPPLNEDFDLFLSHDLDSYDGRNVYLPIWATRLGVSLAKAKEFQEKLLTRRSQYNESRTGICAIISNPEPIRMAFLRELQRVFPIDVYGALGNRVEDKFEILSRYKLNVCFENVESPGYVTEKPIEAWIGGCIPIWRGIDSIQTLNPKSIVNVSSLGFTRAIELILKIINDDNLHNSMWKEPILLNSYNFDSFEQKLIDFSNHKM